MNTHMRWRVVGSLFLVAALAGCGGQKVADDAEAGDAPVVPVRTRTIEVRAFHGTVAAPGQWRSASELVVVSPFAAVVERLTPRVGDAVAHGDTLGWLVTRESRAAVRGAELMLSQAQDAAARAEARSALALARRDVVLVPVLATAGGTVVRRTVPVGAEVAEGAELLALVPAGGVVFEAHVPLADAARVHPGQRARVAMEGGGGVETTVQRLLPSTSAADQAALVWLAPAGTMPAGLLERFGSATIETEGTHRADAVPDSALVEDDLTGEVRVARVERSGIAVWTPVRLGLAADGWHELLAPALAPGTPVVVSGQHGLPDSTRVKAGS